MGLRQRVKDPVNPFPTEFWLCFTLFAFVINQCRSGTTVSGICDTGMCATML